MLKVVRLKEPRPGGKNWHVKRCKVLGKQEQTLAAFYEFKDAIAYAGRVVTVFYRQSHGEPCS